ncbi:hypothetical protein HZS_6829 [Henneguya salminicola]|nr:hypothetical protein HZS_6829 [Henneguya salminicola]
MSHMFTRTKLREVVHNIRMCKTLKEEQNLVAVECAEIRDCFKAKNKNLHCVAMTKLLYFYILGYPSNFGQLECLKLISTDRYVDKRIGYLGCMMLLDENADLHVLITNSLQKYFKYFKNSDLNNQNDHIKSLALCTLASICSPDMTRMLANLVEKIICSKNKNLKAKAALCANRLITKVKILRLFSFLARNDPMTTSTITDVVTKVYTGTVLGNFLRSDDRNLTYFNACHVRYIALTIMLKRASKNVDLIERFWSDIFGFVRDEDMGIKKRSLELIFIAINKTNIVNSVEYLVQYLCGCRDSSLQKYVTSNIVTALDKYESDELWHIHILIDLFETVSHKMREESMSTLIFMVMNCPPSQSDASLRLFSGLKKNMSRPKYNTIAIWLIAEYSHLIFNSSPGKSLSEFIDILQSFLESNHTCDDIRNLSMISLMKLAVKFPSIEQRVTDIIYKMRNHLNPEFQQRCIEWLSVSKNYPKLRYFVFSITVDIIYLRNMVDMDLRSTLSNSSNPTKDVNNFDLLNLDFTVEKDKYNVDVYNNHGLKVYFTFNSPSLDQELILNLNAENVDPKIINDFACQMAVSKKVSMRIDPPSTTQLLPNAANQFYQKITIKNPQKIALRVRVKILFVCDGKNYEEYAEVAGFPEF